MLLAPVKELREFLGFDDMVDINTAITEALLMAEPELAAIIGTPFDSAQNVDTFWVGEPPLRNGRFVKTEFKLRRGFLASAPQVKVNTDPSLFTAPSTTDVSSVVRTDLEMGKVVDLTTVYSQSYVEISYTSGFEIEVDENEAPTGSYVLAQVPAWLQQAARVKALILLSGSPVLKSADVSLDTKSLNSQLASILGGKLRYTPEAILPVI